MRLMVAVPCLDMMRSEFVMSFTKIIRKLMRDGVDFGVRFAQGTLTYQAREELAREAIERNYDFMLWFDSDMEIPEDVFDRLMSAEEKTNAALVTGIYRSRRKPYHKLVYKVISPFQAIYYGENLPDELFPIEGCGFGCVLTRVDAMREVFKKYNVVFTPTEGLGEDLAYCYRLKTRGYMQYAEPSVKCGHIGSIKVTCDDATKLLEY